MQFIPFKTPKYSILYLKFILTQLIILLLLFINKKYYDTSIFLFDLVLFCQNLHFKDFDIYTFVFFCKNRYTN